MKTILNIISLLALFALTACNKEEAKSFAIVIDPESYTQAQEEVEAYMLSIKNDGLNPILLIDQWQHPDSIKAELIKLYKQKKNPIEGAVFIGDIPVPMLRDAQHLSSAFKMKQSLSRYTSSSIPSDRFYDDFDLKFDYIKQDTVNTLYHYYSMTANSAHVLRPEIYTGRIKPFNTEHKYEDLKKYLTKVVTVKQEENACDQVLFFAGHGYNSESLVARIDENLIMHQQFPDLNTYDKNISFINHEMDDFIKDRLVGELQREDLDLAILHHHGSDDMEYLNGMPIPGNTNENIEAIKMYVRSKLYSAKRRGKSVEEAKEYYCSNLNIPQSWFDDAFDPEVVKKDSIFGANMDLHTNEVKAATPNARMVILDACFNGSFHLDEYISGAYIFNEGKTIVVQANSVNSLQDKWATEFIGLLGMGMRFGAWTQHEVYLETHVIGDPTYHLSSDKSSWINTQYHNTKIKFWNKQLASDNASLQAFALRKLYVNKAPNLSSKLLTIYKTSPYPSVRNEALRMLMAYNDDNFIACLSLAVDDASELVRRNASYLIGDSGDPRLVPAIVKAAIKNNPSKRVAFATREALGHFDGKLLLQELDKQFVPLNYAKPASKKEEFISQIERSQKQVDNTVEEMLNPETDHKWVILDIRAIRNRPCHQHTEALCDYLLNKAPDDEVKLTMIEAFGWFNLSYQKPLLIETCQSIAEDDTQSETVRNEALKTINRLNSAWIR